VSSAAPAGSRERMRELYDSYHQSHDYDRRYPRPNLGTLDFLLRHGAARARRIADVGCGNGRYALPLLDRGNADLVACDISQAAVDAFTLRLAHTPHARRVQLVAGGPEALPGEPGFDFIVMLFGVLSHIVPREGRIEALRQLSLRAAPDARLLLSVPSRWRRRPVELLASLLRGRGGFGDIEFTRLISGRPQTFHYHLYTVRGLRADLAEAGWAIECLEAESLMPEWLVTQWPSLGRLDRWVQRFLPAALGYGIRVSARRACASRQAS
jgi:SAM-dependent methyltransferase